jgi:hypothetical protein
MAALYLKKRMRAAPRPRFMQVPWYALFIKFTVQIQIYTLSTHSRYTVG